MVTCIGKFEIAWSVSKLAVSAPASTVSLQAEKKKKKNFLGSSTRPDYVEEC